MTSRWELVPRRGIRHDGSEVFLGAARDDVRATVAPVLGAPARAHYPDEDTYQGADGSLVRLRFVDDVLRDIEFLAGEIFLDGLALHGTVRWPALAERLAARGYRFDRARELGDGWECADLGVNIATRQAVGGEGDEIEWVIVLGALVDE